MAAPRYIERRGGRFVVRLVIVVVAAVVLAAVVEHYAAESFSIPSASMEPQLHINDRVVVSKLAYHLHAPRRGDIVVFATPPLLRGSTTPTSTSTASGLARGGALDGAAPPASHLIKRVIGLPGETVEGREGHVWINGRILIEPYLPAGTITSSFGPVVVPGGHLWVMGDNRHASEDSRYFGPIPETAIVGRAVWRLWPLTDLSFL